MKTARLLKRIKLNAIGSAICSLGIMGVQLVILWASGSLNFTIDAHVMRIMIQMYVGSFTGLFSVLHLSSTKL